jgi:hypothetical protein
MAFKYIGDLWGEQTITELASDCTSVQPYYHIGDGDPVDIGSPIATVSAEDDPDFPSIEASYNWEIPALLDGEDNVYFGMRDTVSPSQFVEWGPFDIISDAATSVIVSPAVTTVGLNKTRQFTAIYYDAGSAVTTNHDATVWSVDAGGTIDADTGLFTAGAVEALGNTVTATAGLIVGTATVHVRKISSGSNNSLSMSVSLMM